jgi:hypothetical protein
MLGVSEPLSDVYQVQVGPLEVVQREIASNLVLDLVA